MCFFCVLLLVAVISFHNFHFSQSEECIDREHLMKVNGCCKMPNPLPEDNLKECLKKAQQKAANDDPTLKWRCVFECHYEDLGILSDDTVNMDQVKAYLELLEDKVRDLYERAFQYCADLIEKEKANLPRSVCSAVGTVLGGCVQRVLDQDCPAEYFNESDLCNKVKAGVKICPA